MTRAVVVTGVGLVSAIGSCAEAHASALRDSSAPMRAIQRRGRHWLFPMGRIDHAELVPKRGDRRQMEAWQLNGVYAAGSALRSGGVLDAPDFLAGLNLAVAAGGGERDCALDDALMRDFTDAQPSCAWAMADLNRRLNAELRPSLFLAQLSNMLAGNIAVVFGVLGGSRTMLGEEAAGVEALASSARRIAAGQSDAILGGGSYNAEREDLMLNDALGGLLHEGEPTPVFDPARRGLTPGSVAAFLLLEAEETAKRRGATIRARLDGSAASWAAPGAEARAQAIAGLIDGLDGWRADLRVSAASGAPEATGAELFVLAQHPRGAAVCASGDLFGHGVEAAAPAAAALAAIGLECAAAERALVTVAGPMRGEGAFLLTRAR